MKRLSAIVSRLVAVLVIVLVFWGILEAGLRLFPALVPPAILGQFPQELRAEIARARQLPTADDTVLLTRDDGGPPLRMFKPFTKITWDFDDPGTVKTMVLDKTGFCNPPRQDYDVPSIEILAIGDSHTWCSAVSPDDAWVSRLSVSTGRSAYNLGRAGVGIYEYLQILKTFGLAKSPKVVIMNIAETNDLRDALVYQRYRNGNASGADASRPTSSGILARITESAIGRRSYAFNLALVAALRGRAWAMSHFSSGQPELTFRYSIVASGTTVPFNPVNTDRDEVRHARQLRKGEINLDVLTPGLEKFVELSRQHGFLPVVTYTPSPNTVYCKTVVFEDPSLTDLMSWYSRELRGYVEKQSRELTFTFVDPTPALQSAAAELGPDELLYYASNLHMTRHGNRVFAEALNRGLQGVLTQLPAAGADHRQPTVQGSR
jgi:hypothetical protein